MIEQQRRAPSQPRAAWEDPGRSPRRGQSAPAVGSALALWLLLTACGSTGPRHVYQSAEVASQHGEWSQAADLWRAVQLNQKRKTPLPFCETARALYEYGDEEAACAMLDRGLEHFPRSAELLLMKGRMLESCGYRRAAEALFERLVEVDEDHLEALAALGRLRMALGLERGAAAPLERVVTLGGADAITHESLGDIYRLRGERARALESYARAIELGSLNPRVLLSAVRLAQKPALAQRYQAGAARAYSLVWLRKLCRTCPQYSTGHYVLGLTLHEVGRSAEAVQALRMALEADPNNERARTKLVQIEAQLQADETLALDSAAASQVLARLTGDNR